MVENDRVKTRESHRTDRAPWWLVAVAVVALASGVCVYVFGRPPGTAYMLPADWTFFHGASNFGDLLSGSWPTFAHAFSFSVMTCLVLPWRSAPVTAACLGWFLVECLFEVGQHPAVAPWLTRLLDGVFVGVPVLDHLPAYFRRGFFDPADIAFAAAGSLLAWILARRVLLR